MAALLLLKASVLLAAALGAARVLKRTPAATRHSVWSLAFVTLLALPLLAYALPPIHVPVPAAWEMRVMSSPAPNSPTTILHPATVAATPAAREPGAAVISEARPRLPVIEVAAILIALWAAGTLIALSAVVVSLLRVRQLARTAAPLTDPDWIAAADEFSRRVGLRRRVRLVTSEDIRTPMAGGLTRPTVFLPASAPAWTAERRDVILAHEISHLAGRDPLRHIAARLAVALYWFHPLAWIAAREASVAREQACDEAVLALGTRPSSYAQVLLEFADASPGPGRAIAALPIVERSLLEKRLMAILTDEGRRATRPRPVIPVAAIGILAFAVASARPAALAPAADGRAGAPYDTPAPASAPPGRDVRGEACDAVAGPAFNGSISTTDKDARSVVYDAIGTYGPNRIILRTVGDVRVCMIGEDLAGSDSSLRPSEWPGRATRVLLETRRGGVVQRLETTRTAAGAQRVVWSVGGVERPFDGVAQEWQERTLALLDTAWEAATIRGEVSSLSGAISSLRGQESSLRGEISTLAGEVSTMQGRMSSIRGQESTLRGEMSSIQGHVSSLEGAISSERGAISSIQAARVAADDAQRAMASLRQHEAEIARIEKELKAYGPDGRIADLERRLRALDANGQVSAIESQMRSFDMAAKVAAVERQMQDLGVEEKIAALNRQIAAMDADGRGKKLEEKLAGELRRLQELLARIR